MGSVPVRSFAAKSDSVRMPGREDYWRGPVQVCRPARDAAERFEHDKQLFAEINTALDEASPKLDNASPIKHLAEVRINSLS